MIRLLSPHLRCQHFNFWRQGRSSEPRDALSASQCPLFSHYSWITTTTSRYRFKDFKYGDTSTNDLSGRNGQYLSVVSSKRDVCCVFFWRHFTAQSRSWSGKAEISSSFWNDPWLHTLKYVFWIIIQNETTGRLISVKQTMKSRLWVGFPQEINDFWIEYSFSFNHRCI